MPKRRNILFLTGTRAELGLMLPTLAAIRAHPALRLRVAATGMHLDPRAGPRLAALKAAGITPDAVIPWPRADAPRDLAEVTARASARLARLYRDLRIDALLVVGDRVEAFAAACAAHVARIPIAHVHGGDRAEGQVDDALRHAITQLSHLHLAATDDSAARLLRLGQHPKTVHVVGAPGVEHIRDQAAPASDLAARFPHAARAALVLLHPTSPDAEVEARRTRDLLAALARAGVSHALCLTPNNDPGSQGIRDTLASCSQLPTPNSQLSTPTSQLLPDLPRPLFLGLLRDCRLLVGNSSAGIIEAASFGTPVVDIGPRQSGRSHGPNVAHCDYGTRPIAAAVRDALARPRPRRPHNPYHRPGTARRIAARLASDLLTGPAPSKLLTY